MDKICKDCGWHGEPKSLIKNYIMIEIVLWVFIFVAGLGYSALSRVKICCRGCKGINMVGVDTKEGKELMEKQKEAN